MVLFKCPTIGLKNNIEGTKQKQSKRVISHNLWEKGTFVWNCQTFHPL